MCSGTDAKERKAKAFVVYGLNKSEYVIAQFQRVWSWEEKQSQSPFALFRVSLLNVVSELHMSARMDVIGQWSCVHSAERASGLG